MKNFWFFGFYCKYSYFSKMFYPVSMTAKKLFEAGADIFRYLIRDLGC